MNKLKIDKPKLKVGDKVKYCVDIVYEIEDSACFADQDGGEAYGQFDGPSNQSESMLEYLSNIEFTIDCVEYQDYNKLMGYEKSTNENYNYSYPVYETYKRPIYFLKEIPDQAFYESDLELV
jgi:hypothetical protein